MRRLLKPWLAALGVLLWASISCGDEDAAGPTGIADTLTLRFTNAVGVSTHEVAVALRITADAPRTVAFAAAPGLYERQVDERDVRLLVLNPVPYRGIVRIVVSDSRDLSAYRVEVLEVGRADGTLIPPEQYEFRLVQVR